MGGLSRNPHSHDLYESSKLDAWVTNTSSRFDKRVLLGFIVFFCLKLVALSLFEWEAETESPCRERK